MSGFFYFCPPDFDKTGMKYRQLTKEQFEALHEEFSQFLATQQIDVEEWRKIKATKPELADEELNLFSDLVWDQALNKTNYLEHFSERSVNLFKCESKRIHRLVVQVHKQGFNFLNEKDYNWFINNTNHELIEFMRGEKTYKADRNQELFELIEKGGSISDGKLYEALFQLINKV